MGEMTLNILTKLGDAWTAILPPIKLFGAAIGYASDAGAQLIDWGVRFTNWITDYLVPGLRTAIDWVDKLIDVLLRLIGVRGQSDTSAPAGAPDAGGLPMARGGFVRGPGGGDVIPALLSAGEFVMSRRAVARWGAGLMQSLNMGPGMPRFAAGGLVPAMGPVVRWVAGARSRSISVAKHLAAERPGCRAGAARARRRAATAFLDRAKTELEAVMSSPGSMSSTAAISGRSPWYVHQSKCSPGLHLNCD